MPGKPIWPKKVKIHGNSLIPDSVGVTQVETPLKRHLVSVGLGSFAAGNKDLTVFRAPSSGAKITAIRVCMGNTINAADDEADNWTYNALLAETRNSNSMHTWAVSLSDVTLFATQFKSLSLSQNTTLTSGQCLMLRLKISGAPAGVAGGLAQVEWQPVSNA